MRRRLGGPLLLAAIGLFWVVWAVFALLHDQPFDHRGGHIELAIAATATTLLGALGWLAAERSATGRTHEALEREREWNRTLRDRVSELHAQHGGLASGGDIRELVLRVAVELTEARRGLLLAPADGSQVGEESEPDLTVVAAVGFDADPSDSRLAQDFAHRVIARDTIVRDDDPGRGAGRADREIHSLVAVPIWVSDRFSGVVVCADRDGGFEECDNDVLLALGDHAGAVLNNARLQGRVREAFLATVRLLAEAIQAKDPFLRGHSEEVAEHVAAVARTLELDPGRVERLTYASLLHDVGKIGISERLLLKPGRLTPEERGVVELHPRIGSRLVEQVPGMEDLVPAILHHHERFDGRGYPGKLAADAIPLEARIIAVADAFSAMTEQRPYRERMSAEAACRELERCAGSQFDPEIVRLFVAELRANRRPPQRGPVAIALQDAEVAAQRNGDEPVLGLGTAALTDGLTLLYSHRYFHETAARIADEGMTVGVALVNLDHLADVNRRAGYATGDEALRDCAKALSRVAVRHGATACRVGGRRLGLLVAGLDEDAATRLVRELADELGPVGVELGCRVTAVVAVPGEDSEATIDRARATLEFVAPMVMAPAD